jgi:ATP-binding protein involved in chromosome partitioning
MSMDAIKNLQDYINEIENILFNNGYKLKDTMSKIIITENYDIGFSIDLSKVTLEDAERVKKIAEKKLSLFPKIGKITIIFTDEKNNEQNNTLKKKIISDGKVIVVASGKGGVGKSSMSLGLAKKLNSLGKSVGIVDLDIYGPSIPIMLGINTEPKIENGLMIPINSDGIKVMSIGFLVKDSDAIAWRGPMIAKAMHQLLFLTLWGKIDYLIIDTPPGTGDIHISLLEKYNIDSAIIITSPDQLSVNDVKKTISLYQKFNINIPAIIENNSFFTCPDNGKKYNLFGKNGGEELSKIFSIPLIDKVETIHNFNIDKDFDKIISDNLIKII